MLSIKFGVRGFTSVKHPPEDNMKNVFLSVGPLVPMRTNWLQTKFSVLNNCLSDDFISDQNLTFADIKTCFTKRSSERTQNYWLPKFKSVCFRKRKVSFPLFAGNG